MVSTTESAMEILGCGPVGTFGSFMIVTSMDDLSDLTV